MLVRLRFSCAAAETRSSLNWGDTRKLTDTVFSEATAILRNKAVNLYSNLLYNSESSRHRLMSYSIYR
jgi:hypothetical protein